MCCAKLRRMGLQSQKLLLSICRSPSVFTVLFVCVLYDSDFLHGNAVVVFSIIDPDIEVAKVATTLEWVIPTPPPLHGFAEPPILVLAPDQTAREQRGH